MKQAVPVLLVLVLSGFLITAGCTGTTSGPSSASSGTGNTFQSTTVATTAAIGAQTTAAVRGRTIIDERINLQSGYPTVYHKFGFEDYGYQYLYPGDTFRITIDSNKPVNVLVIDKGDEIKFPTVIPEWNTGIRQDQWNYSPVVPAFLQSNVLRKEMTFTIKDKSTYFLIIDPRFSSEQTWSGTRHEDVIVDVTVTKT